MKRFALALLILALSIPAIAGELKGVTMQDKITFEGKQLMLNGMGLRTKMTFKVYVAGLYLESPSKNPDQIVASEQIRRVEMVMLRDLGKGKITEAIEAGFEKNNSKEKMTALQARLDKFNAGVTDLEKGDKLVITYVPEKGITLQSGKNMISVEGKDFADALFGVWLGKYPVDADLKEGMLGISD